ncbi:autotransporter outer membrane beta-barrel domain-containing protein [Devosia sp. MC532]|uniref:autotransporter outer membrane beta-barrel domain-containing protein n=1 Tax=Devosia sp. MC532 TaxID=2799788 RepID=UPI0018F424C1|nr:autotransporter outer membrane beta-barrel domain-containing protein [Devosia sp. MC532]MBJ7577066.1 autotransporter outer membrane beta-barrel domain-containing protein [Devosia sp. MC532]
MYAFARFIWTTRLVSVASLSAAALLTTSLGASAETSTFSTTPSSTQLTRVPQIYEGVSHSFPRYGTWSFIYSQYAFQVTETGSYKVVATTLNDNAPIVNVSWILNGEFAPDSPDAPTTPIENFIVGANNMGNVSTMPSVNLTAGNHYTILTVYEQSTAGSYPYTVTWVFEGPGCVNIGSHTCVDAAPKSGSILTNTAPGTINIARDFGHSVQGRMGQLRNGGHAADVPDTQILSFFPSAQHEGLDAIGSATTTEARTQALSFWVKSFGNFISNRGNGASPGFNQSAGGVIFGGDTQVLDDMWIGASLGYAQSQTSGNADSGNASADNYHAGLYANWSKGLWYVATDLGLALSHFKTERTVGASTAKGESHALDTSVSAEFGYQLDLGGTTFTPSAGLRYDVINAKGYGETGAGASNLKVDDAIHHALRIDVGAEANTVFTLTEDLELELSATARWQHDLLDMGYTTTQSLSGTTYQVSATDPGRDAAVLGLGAKAVFSDNLNVTLDYGAELRARQTNHTITAGLRFTW